MGENKSRDIGLSQKEVADYKHKLKMEELKFQRESDIIRSDHFHELEKQKHEWKLEEQRIFFAEQRKHQAARERAGRFR